MKKHIIAVSLVSFVLIITTQQEGLAGTRSCGSNDAACREFAALAKAGRHEKIVEKVKPNRTYSEAAKELIGKSYLVMAGKDGVAPEQVERLCRKALEYGETSAYMGLYFIYVKTDLEKANGFLKQYVATKPENSMPYVLLGQADFDRGNYEGAKGYLKEARKIGGAKAGVDWLLFKASYLAGDFTTSSEMLNSSFSQGKTVGDLKALLSTDPRFSEMGKQPEFRKFYTILNGRELPKMSSRS